MAEAVDTKNRKRGGNRKGTVGFLLICLTISSVISAAAILLAREIFALNGRGRYGEAVEITLNEPADIRLAAGILKRNGLIGSSTLFRLYGVARGVDKGLKAGTYTLSPSAGYDGLLRRLSGGGAVKREQIAVTVPEGSSVRDLIRIICRENGICAEDELTDAIQNGDFDGYWFVRELKDVPRLGERLYRLEGYLYPDTYYFYKDSSAYSVIDKMLNNFERHFDSDIRRACEKNGMTADKAVNLASIIMREAKFISDYPIISSVFHNRIHSKGFNGRLQSDATLTYALGRPMEGGDKDSLSPYNTYKYAGLPPSAICSPDIDAISYALCPDKTPYYYFVSDKDGNVHYAVTYDQHRKNLASVFKNSASEKKS